MTGINLLPWRENTHRKRLRRAGFYILFWVLMAMNLWWFIEGQNSRQEQQLASQQSALDELNRQYHKTTEEITRLRNLIQNVETLQPLDNQQILVSLKVLSELPLQQGELSQFQQVYQGLFLEGVAQDQGEFEQLNRYLKKQFPQVKLSQFQPEAQALHFRFDVTHDEKTL